MSEAYPGRYAGVAIRFESGPAIAARATEWLRLAAAPAFAIMALLTGVLGSDRRPAFKAACNAGTSAGIGLAHGIAPVAKRQWQQSFFRESNRPSTEPVAGRAFAAGAGS